MRTTPGSRAQARAQARAEGARALAGKGFGWRVLHSLWILPTFAIGLAGGVSFLYIGVRARRLSWLIFGACYLVLSVAAIVLLETTDDGKDNVFTSAETLTGGLLAFNWFVPALHAVVLIPERLRIRALGDITLGYAASGAPLAPPPIAAPPYAGGPKAGGRYPGDLGGPYGAPPAGPPPYAGAPHEQPSPYGAGSGGSEALGPDDFFAAGAQPSSPVDLNAAPAEELARLPGMSPELAGRAVDERERRQGFADAEDFGLALGLPPHQIARLRETAVAGPRQAGPAPGHQDPPGNGPRIVDL